RCHRPLAGVKHVEAPPFPEFAVVALEYAGTDAVAGRLRFPPSPPRCVLTSERSNTLRAALNVRKSNARSGGEPESGVHISKLHVVFRKVCSAMINCTASHRFSYDLFRPLL